MANNEIKVEIKGNSADYQKAIKDAEGSTKKFSDRLVFTLGDITNLAKSAWQMMQAPINAYKESERVVNELNQSMANQGMFTADLSSKYQKMAGALQNVTTFNDDQIISAQGVLQSFIGQRQVSEELVRATLDLAAAKKMDLASAAEMVGKSIGTETNALARSGIELGKNLTTTEKMSAVIGQLSSKYEGQAEAQAKGLGTLEQLNNTWDDFLEGVGKSLAPMITIIVKVMKDLVTSLNEGGDAFKGITFLVNGFSIALAVVKNFTVALGTFWGNVFGFIGESIDDLVNRRFGEIVDNAKLLGEELYNTGVTFVDDTNKDIAIIQDAARQAELAKEEEHQRLTQESKKKAGEVALAEKAKMNKAEAELEKKRQQEQKEGLAVVAQMQSSQFGVLKALGKAAALGQIAIDTPAAAMKAYSAFAFFPPLATAMAAAVYAFGAEQAARVLAANQGGIVTGGRAGIDSVPALLTPGELVVPQQNFEEVVQATRSSRGEGGASELIISFKDELMDFIETKLIERQRLGIAIRTV